MSEELYDLDEQQEEFEEELPEAPQTSDRVRRIFRFTRMLLLLIMSVTAIIVLFINKDKLNMDNLKRLAAKIELGVSTNADIDNSVIDFDYNATGKIKVFKDGIARVTDDNLVILDNIGTQFQSSLTGFADPQIITGARFVCVFDRGSKKLMVADSFSVVFEHTFADNIVTASINDNGYLAVVTQSEAYKNHVIVFDSSFREIYKVNSLTRYIVGVDVSPDNKRIVVSSLYSKNEKMIPQINSYTLSSKDVAWTVDYDGSIAVDVKLKTDGSTVALFDWGISVIDAKGKEKYRYQFDNNILQRYSFDNGKNNVIVTSASHSGVSCVTVFNNNGKKLTDIQLDFAVLSVDLSSDRIAVLSSSHIYIYNAKGKLLSQRECASGVTEVMFSDQNSVITVGASNAVYNIMK